MTGINARTCLGGVALAAFGWAAWGIAGPGVLTAQAPVGFTLAARDLGVVDVGSAPSSFTIAQAESRVRVDGRLDDAAWSGAVEVPISWEVNPGDNLSAPVQTSCRLTYDAENLYLGCTARDPRPASIRAFVTDRDAIDGQDRIVLTLDPFLDQRRAFQFGVSALGVQSDAVLAQQGTGRDDGTGSTPADPAWDAIWSSAGTLTSDGYVVEAAIPFQSLRFPSSSAPQTWGMILTRWWPRSSAVELRSAPLDRGDSCLLCQANHLSGLSGMTVGRAIQLSPTLTASRIDARANDGAPGLQPGPTDPEWGLDAKWGITSDLTLDLTANPDFSQVEADVAQLDVNSRFALFFPEKRPFFLEGADFFGTPISAVFTRSIAEPTIGAKATGKVGANALGVLVARDRSNNLLFPGAQSSDATTLDDATTTTVVRTRRDVGASSSVGALLTNRQGSAYHNTVGGFDLFARPIPSLTLQAQALRSSTAYPTEVAARFGQREGSFGGTAATASAHWGSRNWQVDAQTNFLSGDFRADAGFIPQAGRWGRSATATRIVRGDADRWFSQLRFIAGVWRQTDPDRHVLNGGHWFGLVYQGPMQTTVGFWPNFIRKYDAGRSYEGMLLSYFNVRVRPSGGMTLGLDGQVGDEVDYVNGGQGSLLWLSPLLELRTGRHLETRLSHTHQRLDRAGARVFTADLTRVRAVYSFSARSFVRAVFQRQEVTRNPDLNAPGATPSSLWRFAQFTYGYKVNPQTVIFLGYGEDQRGQTDATGLVDPLAPDARSFYLKLGYAWRP